MSDLEFDEFGKKSPVWLENFILVRKLVDCNPLFYCWTGKKFYWLVHPFPTPYTRK